jgi:hypothetical protein
MREKMSCPISSVPNQWLSSAGRKAFAGSIA